MVAIFFLSFASVCLHVCRILILILKITRVLLMLFSLCLASFLLVCCFSLHGLVGGWSTCALAWYLDCRLAKLARDKRFNRQIRFSSPCIYGQGASVWFTWNQLVPCGMAPLINFPMPITIDGVIPRKVSHDPMPDQSILSETNLQTKHVLSL